MSAGHPFNIPHSLKVILAGFIVIGMFSCSDVIPRKYPKNTPFVYKYNINVEGNLKKEEKETLETALAKQLDDSIGVRTTRKFFRSILNSPPIYKHENADRSVSFMNALMVSLGYFYDTITYDADTLFKSPDQYRTTVNFNVKTGTLVTLDSIDHVINHPDLQRLTDSTEKESLLKKGGAFAKGVVTGEGDRLVELYRNNGYLRFTREELMGLWDTLDVSLLQPSSDPFEQIEILQKLTERRKKPTANIEIRLRPGLDSVKLTKYHVGTVNIYPDYGPETDTLQLKPVTIGKNLNVLQQGNSFRPNIFRGNIYLRNGEVYSQRRSQRTLNRLNALGAWRLVNIHAAPRTGQDTVDFKVLLTPADKYVFSSNLEATQNQTAFAGSLFGLGINIGVQNRNFAKSANLSNTNIRYGVELGDSNLVQTQQLGLAYKIYFPRPWPNFKFIKERDRDNINTVFSFYASVTERRDLFNLRTVGTSLGYEFQRTIPRTTKRIILNITPINIDYAFLIKRQGLEDLIISNPSLKTIFTDGFIPSGLVGITYASGPEKKPQVLAGNLEFSPFPLIPGLINSDFLDTQLYRFIKISAEYTKLFKYPRTALAFRAFAGLGYEFESTVNPAKKNNLPFFKQYYAGGPNSMRAWSLRKLGPGSTVKSFAENPDRFGDVQLEFNAEFRFLIATIAGFKIESALFTDIGNVWYLKKEATSRPEEVFNFGRLGKDLAVGVGTGLRVDFNFFLIRLDYSYKAKDPSPEDQNYQNKWFGYKFFDGDLLQLGINYPFRL
jgi:outer membrane protein insertion porin family